MDDNAKNTPTSEELKKRLTPEQYHILREGGTEAPFTGTYYNSHEKGMYVCAACGNELFSSDAKFDSGTGWPSFTDPMNRENVELLEDRSHDPPSQGFGEASTSRVEVRCKKCGSHLGHVFDDGPGSNGKRYCINSVCLELKKE